MEIVYYPICAVLKLLGNKYKDRKCKTVKNDVGDFVYGAIELIYSKGTAFIETGIDVSLEDSMVIVGTEGTIHVPDDWWNLGYFKWKEEESINSSDIALILMEMDSDILSKACYRR